MRLAAASARLHRVFASLLTVRGVVAATAALGTLLAAARPAAAAAASVRPAALRCEYLADPLGIDAVRPRLSWTLAAVDPQARGLRQTAYRVLVASSPALLTAGRGDLWDTGKVASARTIQMEYAGRALRSRQRCWWAVRVWDQGNRASAWSPPAWWEMGLLRPSDWRASWVALGSGASSPLPLFRREFRADRPLRSARAYVCGLGHYELRINGRRVGDRVLAPGWTNYRRTCLYNTYDITPLLRTGRNAAGVLLGNGMYNVPGGRYVKFTGSFGRPRVICYLALDYTDGTSITVGTDASWSAAPGPITFSCAYGGEDHDARRLPPGWDRPGFVPGPEWRAAAVTAGPGGVLRAEAVEPIVVQRSLAPTQVTTPRPGVRVYDFGANYAARPALVVSGPAGSSVRLTPGELLRDGLADQGQSGGPAYATYTLRGVGREEWTPRFWYYGFRYLQVETTPASGTVGSAPTIVSLRSEVLYPRVTTDGAFACANPLLNRIHGIIGRAIVSNMKSVLTDCPHREKLGWLEQNYLMGPSLTYGYGLAPLYGKIQRDMAEAQTPDGLVPDIAPEYTVFQGGFRDSPEWGSSFVIAPWQLYERYGDTRLLREHYPAMARYVDYLLGTAKDGIVSHGLGDWADVGASTPTPTNTPAGVTATAILYQDLAILRDAARLLGQPAEAQRRARLADATRQAFNRAFFHPDTAQVATGSQTANGMALALGLVEPRYRAAVLAKLVADVEKRGYHTTAGDVGHRYVLLALAQGGRSDVVYRMAARTDHPSYGYQVAHGATSLTEAWDGPTRGWSQNHFMMGHIDEWFYRYLAGIDADGPAFGRVVIRPHMPEGLAWASASYRSARGTVSCRWQRWSERARLRVTVPPNTTALVHVPADSVAAVSESGRPVTRRPDVRFVRMEAGSALFVVGSGTYTFEARAPRRTRIRTSYGPPRARCRQGGPAQIGRM